MKRWKFLLVSLLILCLLLIVVRCCGQTHTYKFAQSLDAVERVEICRYDYEQKTVKSLKVLNQDEAISLLADVEALTCHKHFGDHTMDYGEIVVYITYTNSEAEVLGIWNTAQIDSDGNWHIGIEYFDDVSFAEMILKYIDAEFVPELNQYLK